MESKYDKKAIASMILGILSIVFAAISISIFFWVERIIFIMYDTGFLYAAIFISFILGVTGLILGLVNCRKSFTGMSIAGIILSIIGIMTTVTWAFWLTASIIPTLHMPSI